LSFPTMMSHIQVLPFDIIALIIDIVGENNDTNLLKELTLVSHSLHSICSKHLFATIDLHDANTREHVASSKDGFVKLLESRPDVVKYIRKLTYKVRYIDNDSLLSPILPNFLRTISNLNCLTIDASTLEWSTLDSALTSAFLHLMHLPSINHITLSYIQNFPLYSLTPTVILHRLDMFYLGHLNSLEEPEIVVQSEMMPKIREFHIIQDIVVPKTKSLLPAFNVMDLRRLSMSFYHSKDERNIRYLLKNAKLLEKLHLSVYDKSLVGLLSLSVNARTLKVLDLTVFLHHTSTGFLPLAGVCVELEAMAGHNMLEALFFEIVLVGYETEDFVGSEIQEVEKVLVKPGWPALRRVSFRFSFMSHADAKLFEALQSLPDKYLSHPSKLESVAVNYSVTPDSFSFSTSMTYYKWPSLL